MCEHVFPRSAAAYSTILALQLLQRAGPVTSATKPGADLDWRRQAWRPILQDMESRAQLRAELVDAIAKVNHQIWVDQNSMGGPVRFDPSAGIDELRRTLSELEEALANLGADGA
jgi:hypothetical protein